MVYSKAAVYTCKPLLYKNNLKERRYLHSVQQSYDKNSCKPGIKYFTSVNCWCTLVNHCFTVICQFTLVNCHFTVNHCFTVICQFTLVNCHFTLVNCCFTVNCHFTVIHQFTLVLWHLALKYIAHSRALSCSCCIPPKLHGYFMLIMGANKCLIVPTHCSPIIILHGGSDKDVMNLHLIEFGCHAAWNQWLFFVWMKTGCETGSSQNKGKWDSVTIQPVSEYVPI